MPSAYARRDRKTMWLQRIRSTANPTPQSSFGQLASLMTKTKGEGEQWNVRPCSGGLGTARPTIAGRLSYLGTRRFHRNRPTERGGSCPTVAGRNGAFLNCGVATVGSVVATLRKDLFLRIAQAICVLKNALTAAEGKNDGALSLTSMSTRAEGRDVFCPSFLINPKGKPK